MQLRDIGVVGAGTIGRGLAQSLAVAGHRVVLVDVSEAQLESARQEIRRQLRLQRLLDDGRGDRSAADVLGLIEFSPSDAPLQDVHFLIENVTEDWEIKKSLYPRLDSVCSPEVVFGVNTSAISITRIAGLTRRAPQVLGMHFMNPVPLMPMVEVIRGHHTSEETLSVAKRLLAAMGKSCIVVNDSPGFVTNRVMMQMVNEAVLLVQEGVAAPADIDRLFKTCFNHRMGPLETADLIGLDTVLSSIEVIQHSFEDSKYRPSTLLKRMVAAGLLGRKTGEGFYRYGIDL